MGGETGWAEVGEQVRRARLAAGMSQADLAAQVDLDQTMINKVERGRRKLDAFELSRVARALSVPMGLLIEPRPAVLSRRAVPIAEDEDTVVSRESERMDVALAAWLSDIRQLVDLGVLEPRSPITYPGTVSSADHARQAAA